eukprot:763783-Hanusia_phi.AAC.1
MRVTRYCSENQRSPTYRLTSLPVTILPAFPPTCQPASIRKESFSRCNITLACKAQSRGHVVTGQEATTASGGMPRAELREGSRN